MNVEAKVGLMRPIAQTKLSQRQQEVLHWAGQGKTDSEIGAILGIDTRTSRFHINKACQKLGVRTRMQAVLKYDQEKRPLIYLPGTDAPDALGVEFDY